MKISVCLPLYNGRHCVEGALDSLVNQTRKPDEVIVRDDCSSDEGAKLIEKYQSLNIDLSTNTENLGMIGNWNKCLEDSTGDIVTFLHQDDGYETNFLQELERDLDNDKNIGMWVCDTYIKGVLSKDNNLDEMTHDHEDIIKKIYTWEYIPAPTAVCFKKKALEAVGFYDGEYKYVAEPDLYFRLVSKGYLVHNSSKKLAWRGLPETRATALLGGSNLYFNEWLYFLEKFSFNNYLVNNEMQSTALSNFYERCCFAFTAKIYKFDFRESFLILKTIFSRGRDLDRDLQQKKIHFVSFLFLFFKSTATLFYYFFRRNAALTYRAIRNRVYNR
jgi:glycosyltransferase involved in cell wall biosynthesis